MSAKGQSRRRLGAMHKKIDDPDGHYEMVCTVFTTAIGQPATLFYATKRLMKSTIDKKAWITSVSFPV